MDILLIISGVIIAYLIGSIPSAIWYSKIRYGLDIRGYGSGNAGATNTFRVLGKKAGIVVMLVDVLKGFIATNAAHILVTMHAISPDKLELWMPLFGFAAALGHIFPVYERFKGGKGVATLLGMLFAINLFIALLCIGVFCIVFIISKYVSLGSMLAALTFPIALLLPEFNPNEPIIIVLAFALASIVVITHQKNIKRLLHGEENKTKISIKRRREA